MKPLSNRKSLAFVLGAILTIFTSVFAIASPGKSNEELIMKMINQAVKQAVEDERRKEEEMLDKLPDVIECDKMQWMTSCDVINRQAKKNPGAPVRVTSRDGIEFNFQPGLPSAVIRLQLEQTPEAAAAYIEYMGKTMGAYKNVASLYSTQLAKRGGMENIRTYDQIRIDQGKIPELPNDKVTVSVFVDSTCNACDILLRNLQVFNARHPNSTLSVYMVDNSPQAFREKVTTLGFKGRILKPGEVNKVIEKGTNGWPAIWLDNKSAGSRDILVGVKTVKMLEDRIMSIGQMSNSRKERK